MRHLNVVLIRPGSYRGKCIGIEVSVLSEVDLKTCPAAFSGVLDSTFHFLSGLRALNHQIMSSDNAGKWVKRQGQLHTERSLIHPLCWLCSPLHFKSCTLFSIIKELAPLASFSAHLQKMINLVFLVCTFLLFCSYFIFCSSTYQVNSLRLLSLGVGPHRKWSESEVCNFHV